MAMSEAEVKTLVGLTTEEAGRLIQEKGSYFMVATEDGKSFPIHMMLDPDRVCIHVEKGKVTGATVG